MKYSIMPMDRSIRFLNRMFTVFLALLNPDSTSAKPACMNSTSTAQTIRNILSMAYAASPATAAASNTSSAASCAQTGEAKPSTTATARNAGMLNHFFFIITHPPLRFFTSLPGHPIRDIARPNCTECAKTSKPAVPFILK